MFTEANPTAIFKVLTTLIIKSWRQLDQNHSFDFTKFQRHMNIHFLTASMTDFLGKYFRYFKKTT